MLTTTVYMHLMDNLQHIATHQLTTFLITHNYLISHATAVQPIM